MNIWLDDKLMPIADESYICTEDRVTDWIWVKNLAELNALLASNDDEINEMSFDYNLGPREPNGYEIIAWLHGTHPARYPLRVRVHSGDPKGSKLIYEFDNRVRDSE